MHTVISDDRQTVLHFNSDLSGQAKLTGEMTITMNGDYAEFDASVLKALVDRHVKDAVAAARAAALESAAKAMCAACRDGNRLEYRNGKWMHDGGMDGIYFGECHGARIRALVTSPPPPDARDAALRLALPVLERATHFLKGDALEELREKAAIARDAVAALPRDAGGEQR